MLAQHFPCTHNARLYVLEPSQFDLATGLARGSSSVYTDHMSRQIGITGMPVWGAWHSASGSVMKADSWVITADTALWWVYKLFLSSKFVQFVLLRESVFSPSFRFQHQQFCSGIEKSSQFMSTSRIHILLLISKEALLWRGMEQYLLKLYNNEHKLWIHPFNLSQLPSIFLKNKAAWSV